MCRRTLPTALALFLLAAPVAAQQGDTYRVGAAKVDVTPDYPVRLSGFGFRRAESEGVNHRIHARALAISGDGSEPVVILAVDNLGLPFKMVRDVAARLEKKAGLKPDRLAVTATHTHTAPMLTGVAPTLFGQPISPEHQKSIDRYTSDLADKLEQAAISALKNRQPAKLSYGIGKVTFAINRRTKGGPVDHDLPVLVARDAKGKVIAVWATYACHCVTLSDNKISGDWAGFAQEAIEDDHPGAVALVSAGCGADSNPSSGVSKDKVDVARGQGVALAREARRVVAAALAPVSGKLTVRWKTLELPLDKLPTREEWETKAKRTDAIGHHARVNLARLDRGEKLKSKIDYPMQTLTFGESLAVALLPGEVVVDYALRLKKELDRARVWVCAYSNDSPCYIPSERVLKEGGYEGGGAMVYYDLPTKLRPGLEDKIINAVRELIGDKFKPPFDPKKVATPPLSPQQSLAEIQVRDGLRVELVAAEPLVTSPVAIAFGPDGKLWVCEMYDYPSGLRGDFKPGGRVKVLEDTDGDGKFDKATIFLDNIPFPTGVTVWRKGVLVCAAPDILYAEDTDEDGKADKIKKLFSGFGTENYQGRVNSLEYGLDGWIYGSCGLFGGKITSFNGKVVELGDRDFRMKPDTGELEPATGRTQQGRVRDDWGNWFGCDNSNLCRHYPLADHYLRRNPHVAPPPAFVNVPVGPDPNKLYPLRRDVQLFKLSGPPGRTTAACGLGIYRDELLGKEFSGNAFVCEPVNLLVHRLVLTPRGSTFEGRRAKGEEESEFLASRDPWFRPVQATTGPDGALWVVDMYRYVIEHPKWIPPEELAKVDLRAGSTMGRIYRVVPKAGAARAWPRLDKLDAEGLVKALDSPSGWQRDMASQMLVWRGDKKVTKSLRTMAVGHKEGKFPEPPRPEARLHALCVLDGLGGMAEVSPPAFHLAIVDNHADIRRHALRLSEPFPHEDWFFEYVIDPFHNPRLEKHLVLQVACTLGQSGHRLAPHFLGDWIRRYGDDPHVLAAALSGSRSDSIAQVTVGLFPHGWHPPSPKLVRNLFDLATAMLGRKAIPAILSEAVVPMGGDFASWQFAALVYVTEELQRRKLTPADVADATTLKYLRGLLDTARRTAEDEKSRDILGRIWAIRALGHDRDRRAGDQLVLGQVVKTARDAEVQTAAIQQLARIPGEQSSTLLLSSFKELAPARRQNVIDALLTRDAWQRQLLDAVAKNDIPTADIDGVRRQRLLYHSDAAVRVRAAKLFGPGPGNAPAVVRGLLDPELPDEKKNSLIENNLGVLAEVLAALTADFKPGTKEEYLRIPLLWRVSVAAGKHNDGAVVRKILGVSLPKEDEPLRHWQAVVLGGGIVNGISLKGGWPGRRLDELMKDDKALKTRWSRSLEMAYEMADDAKVPSGTRYDALRMIALDRWGLCKGRLAKYLKKDAHAELQQGAVSGVGDAEHAEAGSLLLKHLGNLTPNNRKLAVAGLLRTEQRVGLLLDALEKGTVNRSVLSAEQVRALRDHSNAELRARARKLLP